MWNLYLVIYSVLIYKSFQTHQLHSSAKVEEMIQLPADLTKKRDNFENKLQVKFLIFQLNYCFLIITLYLEYMILNSAETMHT